MSTSGEKSASALAPAPEEVVSVITDRIGKLLSPATISSMEGMAELVNDPSSLVSLCQWVLWARMLRAYANAKCDRYNLCVREPAQALNSICAVLARDSEHEPSQKRVRRAVEQGRRAMDFNGRANVWNEELLTRVMRLCASFKDIFAAFEDDHSLSIEYNISKRSEERAARGGVHPVHSVDWLLGLLEELEFAADMMEQREQ